MSERAKEVREKNEAFAKFQIYIRDFWAVLKRHVRRHGEPAEVLTFYGLNLNGIIPRPKSHSEWLVLGEKLLEGEKEAVLKGYPPMLNPDIQEVSQTLSRAKAEAENVAIADRKYDEVQEALAKLRLQMSNLLAEVMIQLRFYLRGKDAPSRRRIMRTYGAKFKHTEDESLDERDETDIIENN